MPQSTHVVFGHSARGSLQQMLRLEGRDDNVLNFWGTYIAGPIQSANEASRAEWLVENFFGVEQSDWLFDGYVAENRDFRRSIRDARGRILVWLSRRCAREYCDFLEFLTSLEEGREIAVVDMTDARYESPGNEFLVLSVSAARPATMANHVDRAEPLSNAARRGYIAEWRALAAENAMLRILDRGTLRSSRLDHFDERLIALMGPDARKAARVVGDAMAFIDHENDQMQRFGDLFWFNRIRLLSELGRIEWQGKATGNMREVEVRRLQ